MQNYEGLAVYWLLELVNGEVMGATRRAKLESVMADTGEQIGTKAGKVNVPDDAPDVGNTRNSNRYRGARWSDTNRSAMIGEI